MPMFQRTRRISWNICAIVVVSTLIGCRSSRNVTTSTRNKLEVKITADSSAIECDTTTWYVFDRDTLVPVARKINHKRTATNRQYNQDNCDSVKSEYRVCSKRRDDALSPSCFTTRFRTLRIMAIIIIIAVAIVVVTFFRKK